MSQLEQILARIDAARPNRDGKPMTDQAISNEATGRPKSDLIRNWRRAVRAGSTSSTRLDSLEAVAAVLGVQVDWLRDGASSAPEPTSLEDELIREINHFDAELRDAALKAALATVRAIKAASS